MVKKRLICTLILFLIGVEVSPQSLIRSVISVTGNTSNENMGMLSYSAGETITGSLISSPSPVNGLTQGFQQPSLLFWGSGDVNQGINAVEVYPNPVIKNLTILFTIRTSKLLHVDLFSGQGTLYRTEDYNVSESGWINVEMEDFSYGLYLLHVYSTDKLIDRIFKIEKM
jgi:hypothetical protein